MSGGIDWTAISAVGTVALAAATFALVLVTIWQRRADARARDATALRAAIFEQLENLRRWLRWEPSRVGQDHVGDLRDAFPEFAELEHVIRHVSLPEDLGIYLVWLVGDIRRALEHVAETINRLTDGSLHPVPLGNTSLQDDWELLLDRLQVTLGLVQAEAQRRRLRSAVMAGSADLAWTRPRPNRRALTAVVESIYLHAPPFPAGRAYGRCSVSARDAEAARDAADFAARSAELLGPPVP